MINQDKPTSTMSNSAKLSVGATWDSIETTWNSEPRTWLFVSQLMTNFTRAVSTMINQVKP